MARNNSTWVVVANSSCATIYKMEKIKELKELQHLEHPESRLHSRDLVTSRPGRSFESMADHSRHALEPPTSPQKIEFMAFARTLCEHLELARKNGDFDNLYLAASPSFLGLLRQYMSMHVNATIKKEIDKDMTHMQPKEICEYIGKL
jgi:protein required for attachment to host cells